MKHLIKTSECLLIENARTQASPVSGTNFNVILCKKTAKWKRVFLQIFLLSSFSMGYLISDAQSLPNMDPYNATGCFPTPSGSGYTCIGCGEAITCPASPCNPCWSVKVYMLDPNFKDITIYPATGPKRYKADNVNIVPVYNIDTQMFEGYHLTFDIIQELPLDDDPPPAD